MNSSKTANNLQATVELVEQLLPLSSAFFAHEDDGVSEEVFDFISGYIKWLKTMGTQPYHRAVLHAQILVPCVCKLRYDKDYDFDHEAEDEEAFIAYCAELKRILVNLALLVKDKRKKERKQQRKTE